MSDGILVGIAGGTGAGKTLVARRICEQIGSTRVLLVSQDSYYVDLGHLTLEERIHHNFDHPDALDSELLIAHSRSLKQGNTVEQPCYDFATHIRRKETTTMGPHSVIILEGILVFVYPELRELMDIKVFVDADPDIRLIRRLRRDIIERGRSIESVLNQYAQSVRPMHLQFVEPSKRYADVIVPEGGYNTVAVDLLKTKIEVLLNDA